MKPTLFSINDRNAILTALNYVYDYENVSRLQLCMDITRYGALYDSAYDKLVDYCALTHFTNEELSVLEDALVAVLLAADPKDSHIFLSAAQKVQSLLEAVRGTAPDPSGKP